MAGVLRPGRFPYEDDAEPLAFNLFQFDTLEAIIERCAEAGRASEDRDECAPDVTPDALSPIPNIGRSWNLTSTSRPTRASCELVG
jgi:hypothetical protein